MNTKYVVCRSCGAHNEIVTLVAAWDNHADALDEFQRDMVVSAGEFTLTPENDKIVVSCFGKSTTLDIESRGEKDAWLIAQFLRLLSPSFFLHPNSKGEVGKTCCEPS